MWSPYTKRNINKLETFCISARLTGIRPCVLYRAVIHEIIKIIPGQPSVKKVTMDFERAIWSAFQKVLPEVRIMGCAFHWTQALWRKVSVGKVLFPSLSPTLR